METMAKYFEVNAIKFNNFSSEITLSGCVFQENMSYATIIKLDLSLINVLTNYLQRNNPHEEILERMETEMLPDNELHYRIDLFGLERRIPLDLLHLSDRYIQVRA